MKQVLSTPQGVVVGDVPPPALEPGTVLVRVDHSCISVGTELSGVRIAETPLWRRALADPSKAWRAVARRDGVRELRRKLTSTTSDGAPLGYSLAGIVVEVGQGIHDIASGDPVACAGAGAANHAEFARVPRNLVVPLPDSVDLADASVVALGAIALQGVRRAMPTLGETVVVIGLGAIGQLTAQLLQLHGCRVAVADVDARRVDLAISLGAHMALEAGRDMQQEVARLSGGVGADAVIITASTPSSEVVSEAFSFCRKKGRVVLVGDVGLDLRREDIYAKELDFLVSTSYGPGRYDRSYEEDGLDYPLSYVRWTENRNMTEIIRLIEEERLHVRGLITRTYPLTEAPAAYAALQSPERPLLVLLNAAPEGRLSAATRQVQVNSRPSPAGHLQFALVGPGSFATAVHLPNLVTAEGVTLRAVVGRTGATAKSAAYRFGAVYASCSLADVLRDSEIDAVMITTRHRDHAALTLEVLDAGKHVFVEKPLAISQDQLERIREWFSLTHDPPVLLTGFNRRFSRHAQGLRELLAARVHPVVLNYQMNAGFLTADSWAQNPDEGGRNLGEGCHVYDLFTYLVGHQVTTVDAHPLRPRSGPFLRTENFVATMSFSDGSVATLTYSALGTTRYPKERLTAYWDGRVAVIDDYKSLEVTDERGASAPSKGVDKGHRQQLHAFIEAVRTGQWASPLWQQLQATEIALRVNYELTN